MCVWHKYQEFIISREKKCRGSQAKGACTSSKHRPSKFQALFICLPSLVGEMSSTVAAGWQWQQPHAWLAHINLFKADRRKVPVVGKVSFHILLYKEGEPLLEVLLWVSLTRNVSRDYLLCHTASTELCHITIPHLCYTVITGMFWWSLQPVSHCHQVLYYMAPWNTDTCPSQNHVTLQSKNFVT